MGSNRLHEQFKRRVRIEGGPDQVIGWKVKIIDAETGEEIRNVFRAIITLDARELNAVELFYYEVDEQTGKLIARDGKRLVERRVKLQFPEVAVDAWEVQQEGEKTDGW
jgi:hypothetical protein